MPDAVEELKRLLARWMDRPDDDHPYRLSLDRFDEHRADQAEWLDEDVAVDFAAGSAGFIPGMETRSRGREQFFHTWRLWLEAWGEYRMAFSGWEQHGDAVIVDLDVETSGKLSGVPTSLAMTQIWVLREGRLASLRMFSSRRAALAELKEDPG